jgi:hypothetical protein
MSGITATRAIAVEVPNMVRLFEVTADDLVRARAAYEANEPRDLFYRVALSLIEQVRQGSGLVTMPEALAVLLQTWNRTYYQRQRVAFDAAHFDAIDRLLLENASPLAGYWERSIDSLDAGDEPGVRQVFADFARVLGPVGAAKALHLLAPRFFALWDNKIADKGYGLYDRGNRAYWLLMRCVQAQVRMVGGDDALGRNPIKAIDELAFCRFTLDLDLGPVSWVTPPDSSGPTLAAEAAHEPRAWRHGEKSQAMRELFEQGVSIADTARAVGVDYAFAYGVHERWLAKQGTGR